MWFLLLPLHLHLTLYLPWVDIVVQLRGEFWCGSCGETSRSTHGSNGNRLGRHREFRMTQAADQAAVAEIPAKQERRERPRLPLGQVLDGIFHVLRSGCHGKVIASVL